ncbi:hypothetical protein FH972_016862 [Carpinus fangiana]|uniref:Uncharacterized protein n=1 Tax=Carpinus fangiana TaxID=176857 RepID=A0A5N6RK34_9ROSI|nr:hypothetical protein FH972_016862 [Carpinus fangiana]
MSSFVALGTNIYTFGGQLHSSSSNRFTFSPNLNVLDVYRWPIIDVLPVASMIFPRLDPQSLVLDALENPNRILIASLTERGELFLDGKARFFQYDLSHQYWKILFERYIHPKCPLGYDGGKALAVGNKLYWITNDAMLLVYCLDDDKWLLGNLKGRGISFLDKCKESFPPVLLHLENKRFNVT